MRCSHGNLDAVAASGTPNPRKVATPDTPAVCAVNEPADQWRQSAWPDTRWTGFPNAKPAAAAGIESGSVRQRIAAATHHGGDEIAAQPRPRYFKMALPALIRRNQRTSSVPLAGRTASYARPPPQRASVRKPSISAAVCALLQARIDYAGRRWPPTSRTPCRIRAFGNRVGCVRACTPVVRFCARGGRRMDAPSRPRWGGVSGLGNTGWGVAMRSVYAPVIRAVGWSIARRVTSSVSGNVVGCSCFRILFMSCDVWSAHVHGRMPPSRAVVTRLVTHAGLKPAAAESLSVQCFDPCGSRIRSCWSTWPLPCTGHQVTRWSASGPQASRSR